MKYSLQAYIPVFLILMVFSGYSTGAQAMDPVFSQFYAAPVYLNPAFAGSAKCSRVALSQRLLRSVDNFYIANFSYDTYVEALQGGIGIQLTSDQANMYMMRNSLAFMYAYHLRLTGTTDMSFGVQAGYTGHYSRWDRFSFPVDEPPPDHSWKSAVDFSAGMLVFSQTIYGGVSVHHLHEPDISLFDEGGSVLHRKYTLHLGYYTESSGGGLRSFDRNIYYVSPNIIVQLQGDLKKGGHYHAHTSFGFYTGRKPLMLGVWYRHWLQTGGAGTNNTMVFLIGLNMDDYRIGYSYDYLTSDFSGVMHSVHEISLAFRFNCPQRNIGSRIINHPGF